jgi:DNA-binding CsgD family transcriptional regulator
VISLVGRASEVDEIAQHVERARQGLSGVLVVRGDAGIGKTSLLDAVASSASGFEVIRLVGIESEMRLGYAALHQLLTPFLDGVDSLPAPQARALNAAFGISDDAAPDAFLVGLAALTLVTTAATRRPLLVIVDDTQWLDQESADALGFLARRLYADAVCLLVAMRTSGDDRRLFDGVPALTLAPLAGEASAELLHAAVSAPPADQVRARILAEAHGNPLALVELGRALSPDQLTGAEQLPEPLAVDRRLEGHFLRQVRDLPSPTQRLLLVAAAEPTRDAASIWRAGRTLEFDQAAVVAARNAGLLDPGPQLEFRHPLIRSAVYQGADPTDRSEAHEALAEAADADGDVDRRAWHRGAATIAPDDEIADELDLAAQRAMGRGGCAASAALLRRSAELTVDRDRRAIRLLGAAAADLTAGSSARARANLELALPDLRDPLLVARAQQLEVGIGYIDAFPGAQLRTDAPWRGGQLVTMMLDAARALAPLDVHLARAAALETIPMAIYFGDRSTVPVDEVARVAQSFVLPPEEAPTTADLILDALASVLADGYEVATPLLRTALAAALADPDVATAPGLLAKACFVAFALSDDEGLGALADASAATSREQGAFQVLPEAIVYQSLRALRLGALNVADDLITEEIEMHVVLRRQSGNGMGHRLIVAAWRGLEDDVRAGAASLSVEAAELGLVLEYVHHAMVVLELGLGSYQAATAHTRKTWHDDLAFGALRAADTIEAHVRSGHADAAEPAAAYLAERATATERHLDLGLLARSRALLAADGDAEAHFRQSLTELDASGARLHLARTQLVYGEWLRRQKRRRDARDQLQAALDAFDTIGARAFADRARVELEATGASARKRVDETRHDLTPQESQIARLAAGGSTNPEIAERLFISANTVDYHLRKVYRKLEITSRHEIRTVLSDD